MFGNIFVKKKNSYKKVNQSNSTLGVQCTAKGDCDMRFTTLCDSCKHNSGMKKDVSYFEPR